MSSPKVERQPELPSPGAPQSIENNHHASESISDGTDHEMVLANYRGITQEEEARELSLLSAEERLLSYADVYGLRPSQLEVLEDFDRELSLIPAERKAAVHKGYTVQQARQFLRIENNDARRAAARMARYWELRVQQMGNDAFSEDHTAERTTEDDYRRVYEMARKARVDPDVDDTTRKWAKHYVAEYIRGHLLSLDDELDNVCLSGAEETAAFIEARQKRPDIAASEEHKLLFLQCENFDTERAAQRMVRYWKVRFDLFGGDGDGEVFSTLTADALSEKFPRELSSNYVQLLPSTDASGRAILYVWPRRSQEEGCEIEGLLKTAWYILHAGLEGQAFRNNGVVCFVVLKGFRRPSYSLLKLVFKLAHIVFDCIPMNIRAIHDCAPESWFFQLLAPIKKIIMGKKYRLRYWIHVGTEEHIISEIEACGVSSDQFPTELGGNLDFNSVCEAWLEKRRDAGR